MANISTLRPVRQREDLSDSGFAGVFIPSDNEKNGNAPYMEAARRFDLDRNQIERIQPCTPFQRDVIEYAASDQGRVVGHVVYEIGKSVHLERLGQAWDKVVHKISALRTCIFTTEHGDHFQVVTSEGFQWMHKTNGDIGEAIIEDAAAVTETHSNRYTILENSTRKERLLIWTFSHALVNDELQACAIEQLVTAYEGHEIKSCQEIGTLVNRVAKKTGAEAFWRNHFDGLNAAVFPALPSSVIVPRPCAQAEHRISTPFSAQQTYSNAVICRAALAVLLSRYTDAEEVLFGIAVEQPYMVNDQGDALDGPALAIVPTRVSCVPHESGSDLLHKIATHNVAMRGFERIGLRGIRSVGQHGSAACGFQTVLKVTTEDVSEPKASILRRVIGRSESFMPCNDRALLLHFQFSTHSALLSAQFDPGLIDSSQLDRFLRQVGCLIQQFQSQAVDLLVRELEAVTEEDREEVKNWNLEQLHTSHICIHEVIAEKAAATPDNTAVCACDGELTYAELDNLSSRLAGHIQSLGLKQGHAMPLCFEKSKWVIVGLLAVLKAGQAFTLIDPAYPPARIAQICRQVCGTIALCSKLHCGIMSANVSHCIVVDDEHFQSISHHEIRFTPIAKPQDLAYILFTSGSTGEPKGAMIEHRGFASCALKFGSKLKIDNSTRSLQFASYAFGACLLEIVVPLMHGGCICIPSEEERMNDVAGFIERYRVNWAFFTPSFISTIHPESVPALKTLVLGGEPVSSEIRDTWASHVQLVLGYGQSESSTICAVADISSNTTDVYNISKAVGAHFWIIDPNDPDRLAPIGCIGELVVESPGIARGYLVAPSHDKARFIHGTPAWYSMSQLPASISFYRTGDLACYRSDGSVVYLGRRDAQVKIRGQRVELGDIETHLRRQLPSHTRPIVEAVKLSNSSSSDALVAFIVGPYQNDEHASLGASSMDAYILENDFANRIRTELEQAVPQHSIPSYYIRMNYLPATGTGKTDRRELRLLGASLINEKTLQLISLPDGHLNSPAIQQDALRQLWFDSLGLNSKSNVPSANFFELGGDSIKAIKMVNMARLSGIVLSVRDIFENPTLAGLAATIRESPTPHSPIRQTVYSEPVGQSFAQGRLWFLDQLNPGASWYHIPVAVRLRGPLNVDALTTALGALQHRHETLRTTFQEKDGTGIQIVQPYSGKKLKVVDVSAQDSNSYVQLLQQEQTGPFDLASEPGWRATLLRLGEQDHVISIVMHHIISDGWSVDILRRDLAKFYAAAVQGQDPLSSVSPLSIQYRDFAVWQKEDEQLAEQQRQLQYWINQLKDSSPAEFLIDRPRPELLSGKAGAVQLTIEGAIFKSLQSFAQDHHTSVFSVLLAAFRVTHYRLTGAQDATIGTPIANRNRPELEDIIGFFVNTQCMRIKIEDDETFRSLVGQVQATTSAAYENQDVPFEHIVSSLVTSSRDASRNPLVQLIFALHSQENLGNIELEGLEGEPVPSVVLTRFDVEFHLFQRSEKLRGSVQFSEDLFEPKTIQSMIEVFQEVLSRCLKQPDMPVATLPLLCGLQELHEMGLIEIDRTDYSRESSIVDVFRAQVAASPDVIAITDASSQLSYLQLDQQSDHLATWLRRKGFAAETMVAVLAPRSCQTIIAFLGILKANLAYLPLDIKAPTARIETVLSAIEGHKLVLLGPDVVHQDIQLPSIEMVPIRHILDHGDADDAPVTAIGPSATSLAYVIFTSGSTGKPKGVMVEHRAVVRLMDRSNVTAMIPQPLRMAHLSNIAFDASVWEIFAALLNGGTLVCVDYDTLLDPKAIETVFKRTEVCAAVLSPMLVKLYLANAPAILSRLDVLFIAGDRLDAHDAVDAQALVRNGVYNAYGPTENGIHSTTYRIGEHEHFVNGVPIGCATSNSGAYIMDSKQQIVPLGVMGELVVTGDGLARGYTDSAMDLGRFVEVTINGCSVRAYRTGDRARYRPMDGQIEFFGRIDQQVKIRGHRIELAEVEHAMLSCDVVRDAAVVFDKHENQDAEIIGFIAPRDENAVEQAESRGQVDAWEAHFEAGSYANIKDLDLSAIGNDFIGWTSMYDGSEIDKSEMREWLDDTVHTLLNGQSPGHVLEIGTGSGMVLFNLGEGLQSYVGLEPSTSAATFVDNVIKSNPELEGKAKVYIGTATDIGQIEKLRPDLVVLNSVAQYFPTPEYLQEVIQDIVQLPSVQSVFLGDIRSHAINRYFLAGRALRMLGKKATKDGIRQKMTEFEDGEEELLIDPAFFTRLRVQLPQIKHVEILPKRMKSTNELSSYRYAAVLHIRNLQEPMGPVGMINPDTWVDFETSKMDRQALLHLLQGSSSEATVAISCIPSSRTILERHIVEALDGDDTQESLDGSAWLSVIGQKADGHASLSATDLLEIGKEAGFCVELSCARQWSCHGAIDAVFHHHVPITAETRTLFQFPTDDQNRPVDILTNRPLRRQQSRRIEAQIKDQLQALLPPYMIPARILVIEQMPINANGKVDRRELTRRAHIARRSQVSSVQSSPSNEVENILIEEFTMVLGMEVSVNDNFFDLGGHSLLATKLAARVSQRLDIHISVKDIFDQPVVLDLAAAIRLGFTSNGLMRQTANGKPTGKLFNKLASERIKPRNMIEALLCEEYSEVLAVEVGITDNFFVLGGHSLMATKLAARINRRLDNAVSVKDIFDHPIIVDIAKKIQADQSRNQTASNGDLPMANGRPLPAMQSSPFQLLAVEDPQGFVQHEIYPQLHNYSGRILDVYPATRVQNFFIHNPATGHPRTPTLFFIDFPPDSNLTTLCESCATLIEHVDILRTVFVSVKGSFYQVVLEHLDVPIDVVEVEENIHREMDLVMDRDMQQPLRLGQEMLRIAILKKRSAAVRVVLRMSHALYDGLSLGHVVQYLHALYKRNSLPAIPKFVWYMQHMDNSRKGGYEFWSSILQNSSMTVLRNTNDTHKAQTESNGIWLAEEVVDVPLSKNLEGITDATVFTTACALMLGNETGSEDVVFGRLVSGRHYLPAGSQHIAGPCTNDVPVRVHLDEGPNSGKLLRKVQDQILESLPFETLEFDDIKDHCTDWPDTIKNFACVITYQNIDMHPESQSEDEILRLEALSREVRMRESSSFDAKLNRGFLDEEPMHDVDIVAVPQPDGHHLRITMYASRRNIEESKVDRMLRSLCANILSLSSALNTPVRRGVMSRIGNGIDAPQLFAWTPANLTTGSVDNECNLGRLFASSLAKQTNRPPITLVVHKKELLEHWISSPGIEITTSGKTEFFSDFDVEWWTEEMPAIGPISEPGGGSAIGNLIIATKTYDTLPQINRLRRYLNSDSTVAFAQNGVCRLWPPFGGAYRRTQFPEDLEPNWIACVTVHGVTSLGPFKSAHNGPGHLSVGAVLVNPQQRGCRGPDYLIGQIASAPDLAGRQVSTQDLWAQQLEKVVANSIINPLTTVLQCTNGEIFIDRQDKLPYIVDSLIEEASNVLRGLLIDPSTTDILERPKLDQVEGSELWERFSFSNLRAMVFDVGHITRHSTSSMLQDRKAGKQTEMGDFNGWIIEIAEYLGKSNTVPTHEKLMSLVENGTQLQRGGLVKHFVALYCPMKDMGIDSNINN
ncbi:non-ribosomal peptide synthetase [Xylariales sp. PMI_506]|nr:non-ribosomal peptide synthetase [Xylariales sp. PMI_506]